MPGPHLPGSKPGMHGVTPVQVGSKPGQHSSAAPQWGPCQAKTRCAPTPAAAPLPAAPARSSLGRAAAGHTAGGQTARPRRQQRRVGGPARQLPVPPELAWPAPTSRCVAPPTAGSSAGTRQKRKQSALRQPLCLPGRAHRCLQAAAVAVTLGQRLHAAIRHRASIERRTGLDNHGPSPYLHVKLAESAAH